MFTTLSKLNHDCDPNLLILSSPPNQGASAQAVARRDIAAGDEVESDCAAYASSLSLSPSYTSPDILSVLATHPQLTISYIGSTAEQSSSSTPSAGVCADTNQLVV